jgi:D-arabinose 1-dehydrogenase-like Zn-dependent alcohol dehydrogenase
MRAQLLTSFNTPYTFTPNQPKPPNPSGRDILVKVLAASYCHTDAVFASGSMWQDLPRVGSHEFAGEIVALGPDISPSLNLKSGMKVGVPGRAYRPCGGCFECRENDGDPQGYGVWCCKAGNLGLSRDGGFQEFCIADSRQVAPVPQGLEAVEVAPLMCAGVTIWSALVTAGVDVSGNKEKNGGKTVAIEGAGGGLGHLGVQFAAKLGCRVIAVDAGDTALKLLEGIVKDLKEFGKNVVIVDARNAQADAVRYQVCGKPDPGLEGEKGADAVLILPEAQAAFDFGMALLKNHSVCVCVSFPKDGFKMQPRDLVFRHIQLKGVLVGRNHQLRAMLKFAAENGVRAKIKTFKLEELNDLVEEYNRGASGKLVVDMLK